ncbi:MAG: STAS domain-containing protein [Nitrospira sp.]|nr:STAS domain-containing protein [Nitrospira sp.]
MEITEQKKGPVVVLTLKGRLDASTAGRLEEKLLALIDGGEKQFVGNFLELDYISSAGLRVLLMAAKRLKSGSGKIVLSSLKDHIREVFEIAGFVTIFPIFDMEDEAVKSFQ